MKFIKDLFLDLITLPFRIISCIRLIPNLLHRYGEIRDILEHNTPLLRKQIRSMNLAIEQIQKDQIETHAKQFDMTHTAILKMAEGIAELQKAVGSVPGDVSVISILADNYAAARKARSIIIERVELVNKRGDHTDQKVSETLKVAKDLKDNFAAHETVFEESLHEQAKKIDHLDKRHEETNTAAATGAADTRKIIEAIQTAADVPDNQKEEWTGINSPNSDPSK